MSWPDLRARAKAWAEWLRKLIGKLMYFLQDYMRRRSGLPGYDPRRLAVDSKEKALLALDGMNGMNLEDAIVFLLGADNDARGGSASAAKAAAIINMLSQFVTCKLHPLDLILGLHDMVFPKSDPAEEAGRTSAQPLSSRNRRFKDWCMNAWFLMFGRGVCPAKDGTDRGGQPIPGHPEAPSFPRPPH